MSTRSLYVIIAALFICVALASCKKDEVIYPPGTMLITITDTESANLSLSGVGTATIDWGDGSEDETIQFVSDFKSLIYHNYYEKGTRTIKINGDYVTSLEGPVFATNLDVSRNNALKRLVCGSSILKKLDLSKNTALKDLNCNGTPLSILDLSKNTALTVLSCHSCQLSSLDVSKNTALTHLDCSFNKLTSLDVSKNTALRNLLCTHNHLKSLDVS